MFLLFFIIFHSWAGSGLGIITPDTSDLLTIVATFYSMGNGGLLASLISATYCHHVAVSATEHMRAIVLNQRTIFINLFRDAVEGYHSPLWCECELVSSVWFSKSLGGMVIGRFSNGGSSKPIQVM